MAQREGSFKLIKAGYVIDCLSESVLEEGAILVEGSHIRIVGSQREVRAPDGAEVEVFDYPRQTVLPGLVDTHTHQNGFGDGRLGDELDMLSDEMLVLQTQRNLQATLFSGVTSARENGAKNRTTLLAREAVRQGMIDGPRLMLCGRPVAITGGHMGYFGSSADGEDAVRAEVRKLVAEGADYIKITATGGSTITSNPLRPSYSLEELQAIVSEAHKFGKLTGAHCASTQGTINCLETGVDMIIHCVFREPDGSDNFREDVVGLIAAQEVYVNPTLHVLRANVWKLEEKLKREGLTVEEHVSLDERRRLYEARHEHASRMRTMGVKMVAGSDSSWSNYPLGGFVYELEALVQSGYSPIQSILAGTREAAISIGLGDVAGTLESGKPADILVVNGDPSRDINDLWKITDVFQEGRLVYRS